MDKPDSTPPVTPEPPETGAPLHTLLSALTNEFTRAAAAHDATMASWRDLYANARILEGKAPTALKLVSVQVALPVALKEVSSAPPVGARLTARDLTEALPAGISKGDRQEMAQVVIREIAAAGHDRIDSPTLRRSVLTVLRKRFPIVVNETRAIDARLATLQRERQQHVEPAPEVQVLYRTTDIAGLAPERITTLHLDFRLE